MLTNSTEPFSASPNEIALMTKQEFLDFRNPGGKYHESSAYNFSLSDLNRNYQLKFVGSSQTHQGFFSVFQDDENYVLEYRESAYDSKRVLAAVIYNGVMFYSNPNLKSSLPDGYLKDRTDWIRFQIKEKKRVKYLEEYLERVNNTKKRNLEKYSYLFQQIQIQNQPYQIRLETAPVLNKGTTIVILNEAGYVVAQASDEWGATLLAVAREYRAKGLGKLLGKVWYAWNPEYPSGGFTEFGQANAIGIWEDRVRQFLANGWYSDLVRSGQLTQARLKQILSGLRPGKSKSISESVLPEKKPLIYVEKDATMWGPMFIIYDEAFFQEEDEKYIYGFGFFRDEPRIGVFLYTIDYDREFAKPTTYLALQIARTNGEEIYVGEGYGDLLEFENLSNVERKGDYIRLTKTIVDLSLVTRLERQIRRQNDSYDEKLVRLIEMAHSKW